MNHTASKVKVFQTSDYKLFRIVAGNRSINKKKVDKIVKEIQNGNDILDEVPVLVREANGGLDILDGQHRVQIAQQLKRPVHYIIHKEQMSMLSVAKVNSNVEKWKFSDFINCYVQAGNENYVQVQKFHKDYGIGIGLCLILLTHGTTKTDGSNDVLNNHFQQGTFVVKKYKEARQLVEICKQFNDHAGWNSRAFILAITAILRADKCDFAVLLKKFTRDPRKLESQPSWKAYLTNLEEIYNIDNSKRRVIF